MIGSKQSSALKLIIEEYIKTAKPVSSNEICKMMDCSSATIRNYMSDLEELGYLDKEHISSGRIPSEKGYRYYVDNLMNPKEMTGEDMLKLQTIFNNKSLAIDDVITKSLEIISNLTNYTSVILGSSSKDNKLKQVEVLPLQNNNLLAIVITDKGHVEHKNIVIEENISLEEIKKTTELINRLIVGTPLDEVSSKLEFEVKPIIGKYVKQHEALYNTFYNVFNEFASKSNVSFMGRNNILKQPEYDNIDRVKKILDKFEDKDFINNIKSEEESGINIYIGSENEIDDDVTVIKTNYNINGEEGTIALIGPKRMEYNRVVGLLEYIKNNLGD